MSKRNNIAVALLLAVFMTGCADYMSRRDSITFGAGNAVDANKGIQIDKPFPPEAWNTRIAGGGSETLETIRKHQGRSATPAAVPAQ